MGFFSVLCLLCLCARLFTYALWSPFWERADLLVLVCGVSLWVCHFPIGIQGQVWNLIVSITDLCTLTYLDPPLNKLFYSNHRDPAPPLKEPFYSIQRDLDPPLNKLFYS